MPAIASVREAYKGWLRILVAGIAGGDGRTFSREVEDHGRAVAVLPFDPARRVGLVISQFRAPVAFCDPSAGDIVEPIAGIQDSVSPEECARREAMEEAGIRLATLEPVATCWTMPGVSTERMTLFLAEYRAGDRVGEGGGLASEHEAIAVHEWPLRRLADLVQAGANLDMKLAVLVQALRLRRPDLFAP